MNFITNLFNKPSIECPRCLGKGNVSWDDIKRLDQELKWIPGECAYCNGTGKVSADFPSKVSPDNVYLTSNLTNDERRKVINNDEEILKKLWQLDCQTNEFIKQVEYLYFTGNLDLIKITEFYLMPRFDEEMTSDQKKELVEYIEKIIEHRKRKAN